MMRSTIIIWLHLVLKTSDCQIYTTISANDGGNSNANQTWNVDCTQRGMIGLYDDGDSFEEIDSVKCGCYNDNVNTMD